MLSTREASFVKREANESRDFSDSGSSRARNRVNMLVGTESRRARPALHQCHVCCKTDTRYFKFGFSAVNFFICDEFLPQCTQIILIYPISHYLSYDLLLVQSNSNI